MENMGKLIYIIGKSSSGKDTIYEEIRSREELNLKPFIMYTTRPIRAKETDGVEYHFVSIEKMQQMQAEGKVIELRFYDTVHGIWYYFTADGETVDMKNCDYIALGTLESYKKIRDYYGADRVIPVYIEAEDGLRLERYIRRERKQEKPNFDEICRRFLSDQKDFAEEKIAEAGIERRFDNSGELQDCINEVYAYVKEMLLQS